MIPLTIFNGVTDRQGRKLDRTFFDWHLDCPRMQWDIQETRDGRDEVKRMLPAITWQANFRGRRCEDNALPTGLFMLDIDHVSQLCPDEAIRNAEDPARALWEKRIRGREEELDIVCVHKSAGGDGLHVVAMCQPHFRYIAENQAWLASMTGAPYDEVCHDWARLAFLSVRKDFYYIDYETLFSL